MASLEIRPELDELLRDVAGSFTPDSLKQVIQSTKETLGGKFKSLPDDDLYPLLRRLRQEGHITDDNVTMLDKVFASQTSKQEAMVKKVKKYKGLGFHKKEPVAEATSRTEEISEILRRLSADEIHMVNVYGSGGVGKTTVAKQIHSQWQGKHFMVDLREVTSMEVLHFKVLQIFEPSTTTISYEAKPVMDRIQQVVKDTKDPVLLILDNVEQFITEKNDLKKHFVGFLRRLSEIERLKVLLTSRCEVGDTKVVNDYCLEPLQSDSSQELLQSMAEVHLDVDKRERLVKHCRGKPLFLKGMASVLRQEIEKAEDLLSKIEKEAGEKPEKSTKPEGQEPAQAQEESKEEIEPEDLIVLKEMFLKISSHELKDAALAISLFRLPFTASSAAAVLDVPIEKAFLLLESLRNNGIINVSDPDAKELLYDIHPLMLSFVSSIKNEPEFKEKYGAAENIFCTIFIKKMTNLSSMLDADYLGAHKQFQAERANFELVLDISLRESNYVHQLLSTEYQENAMLYFLFEAMLTSPNAKKKIFRSWAESAEVDHKGILSANLRCWEALQTLNSEGIHEAFGVLKKAKSSLDKVKKEETGSKELQLTQGLYLFVEGEMYLKRGQPRVALDKLLSSLETRTKLLGAHAETARCFNSIGNCFCELDKLNDAMEYYKKAYEMRKNLTGSENHIEMPTYKNQMGGVEEKMKNYVKAIELYESALELEKKLKLMTYANTAIFKRNIANACMWKGDYNKALKPAKEAYQIRRELLGNNPDTVRSAFQMGLIYREREDQMRALKFLREAWEMEKVLQKGNHSPVRDRIPTEILYCLRKEEKAAFKADMLEFYQQIWEEEKSFEAFQPSPQTQAIIDKIMQLVSDRQANEDVDLREKYEEEALWYYERAWEAEVGFFRELKREDRPEKQQEMVFKRDQILDRILYLCGELDKEEESKKYEEVQKKFKYKLLKTEEFQGCGRYSREKLQQALGDAPPSDLSDGEDEKSDSDDSQQQEDPSLKHKVKVSSEGSVCDFKSAGVHITFLPGAVTKPIHVTCSLVNPDSCELPTVETEVLVSSVVELSPLNLTFSKDVTLALSYSALKLRDYEVVVKELKDKESNTWEELHTLDSREENGPDSSLDQQEVATSLPEVKAVIRHTGTFVAICRLASRSFTVTAEGVVFFHPIFCNLKVDIPAGGVAEEVQFEVAMKVQEIPAEDIKNSEVHVSPVLHLHTSKEVDFLKPVVISIPVDIGDKKIHQSPPCQIRVFTSKSGGRHEHWEDITERLEGTGPTLENDVIVFQVNHFSLFCVVLSRTRDPVPPTMKKVAELVVLKPKFEATFRACVSEGTGANQVEQSSFILDLFCLPADQKEKDEKGYKRLNQADSKIDLRPEEKCFVKLDDDGDLKPDQNMEDFYLIFRPTRSFQYPLNVCAKTEDKENLQCLKTRLYFSGPSSEKLCDFSVTILKRNLKPTRNDEDNAVGMKEWKEGAPTPVELGNVAENIADCWSFLGLRLGVSQSEIDNIQYDNVKYDVLRKKTFRMLQVWRDQGRSSTYAQLANALCDEGKKRLAETYCT